MKWTIPCDHVKHNVPLGITVNDYHPLTRQEVDDLLRCAAESIDAVDVNGILCRLTQAIPGMVCPHDTEGSAMDKSVRLGELFLSCYYARTLAQSPEQFYELLRIPPTSEP